MRYWFALYYSSPNLKLSPPLSQLETQFLWKSSLYCPQMAFAVSQRLSLVDLLKYPICQDRSCIYKIVMAGNRHLHSCLFQRFQIAIFINYRCHSIYSIQVSLIASPGVHYTSASSGLRLYICYRESIHLDVITTSKLQ